MDYKHVYSRAFHTAVRSLMKEGANKAEANLAARSIAQAAGVEWRATSAAAA